MDGNGYRGPHIGLPSVEHTEFRPLSAQTLQQKIAAAKVALLQARGKNAVRQARQRLEFLESEAAAGSNVRSVRKTGKHNGPTGHQQYTGKRTRAKK